MLYDERWNKRFAPATSQPMRILQEAAHLLIERGWCQHQRTDPWGRMCTMGAIWLAAIGSTGENFLEAVDLLRSCINEVDIAAWNDDEGRTRQQVVDALLQAAGRAA